MHLNRSKIIKAALIFLAILLLSACIELFFFNYHALRYHDNSQVVLNSEELMPGSIGFELDGAGLVPKKDMASILYQFQSRYFNKLVIEYESTDDNKIAVTFASTDSTGKEITDSRTESYDHRLNRSVINIGEYIQSVNLVFPSQAISIKNISLSNEVEFNVLRYVFMATAGVLFAFVLFSRKIMAERIEWAFLITAMSIGTLMIILMPLKNPVTWDDDTHFSRIYEQSFAWEVQWTQAAYDYRHRLVPAANTIEEKEDVINLLNSESSTGNIVTTEPKSIDIPYNFLAYIPQSSMVFLARHLNLNFNATQIMARLGGLTFYALMVYAAISIAKFGKRIIAVIALMPTPLFLASNFSYDPFLISLSFLAFAVFTTEYFDTEHKLGIKNTAIFLASIILACCTKAVYIPLILIALLFPERKFQSKRNMYLFRIGILAVFFTILATFVLPALINPSVTGDLRGGDTSVSGQMHFILNNPVFYTKLLMKSIGNTLGSYFFGTGTYTNFAYLGQDFFNICAYLSIIAILFSVFTDAGKNDKYTFKTSSKISILIIISVIICLIWTALYISFTSVGSNFINGVQSRYYLPLVVPLLFLARSSKIETSIPPLTLNRIVFAMSIFISFYTIYELLLRPLNF